MYDPRRDVFTVEISGQLLAASKTNEGAFVSALKAEMEDAMNEYKVDANRQVYGDPLTGKSYISLPYDSGQTPVAVAKRALKEAKKSAARERKLAKAERRRAKQEAADLELAMAALRDMASDPNDLQRFEAAKELLARTGA